MRVCERIKSVRNEKGYTQQFIAEKLGITVQGYSMKESGQRQISTDDIETIAKALDVSPSIFFEDNIHDKWNKEQEVS